MRPTRNRYRKTGLILCIPILVVGTLPALADWTDSPDVDPNGDGSSTLVLSPSPVPESPETDGKASEMKSRNRNERAEENGVLSLLLERTGKLVRPVWNYLMP